MTGPEPRELLTKALIEIRTLKARLQEVERARHEPIAIVGYGCRFPGAANPGAFWKLLHEGVDAVREVPRDRFDIDAWYHPDPDEPGKIYTRSAAFLDRVDGFDAGFFAISPREVLNLSLQQRLLLEVTWEALEDANVVPADLFGSNTGVFIGQCGFDEGPWNTTGPQRPEEVDLYSLTGTTLSITAGRLSYFLGVNGPSFVVDTACSSSLVALQLACQSLRTGECDRALAGGVHVLTSPAIMLGLCRIKALAPDGRCKSFDARSDGYGRGEGCGVVLLRRLSDALAAGDRIHAVIRGIAVNQDGASGGLTVPSGPSQSAVIRHALKDAGVDPAQVAYVEAHGTGTSLGDPIEMRALHAVHDAHTRERPLYVGSVKSNVGHLEAAAGIAGLLKVVLALEHRVIPPSLHFQNPNPHIPWDSIPVTVPTACVPWPDPGTRPTAGLSSFGLGGTNVHVVLEEAPPRAAAATTSLLRSTPVLLLSGRDESALREAAAQLDRHLELHPDLDLAELCHVAATGRTHFSERAALAATNGPELRAALRALAVGDTGTGLLRGRRDEAKPPENFFLFPGDDALLAGARGLLDSRPPGLQESLERGASILDPLVGSSLLELLRRGPDTPIREPAATLPALVALEVSLAEMWRSFGVEPDCVVGHGIGELAAAVEASVLRLEDALRWAVAVARANTQSGQQELARLIAATPLAPPRRRYLSLLTGAEAGDEIATPGYWLRTLRDPAVLPQSVRPLGRAVRDPQERPRPRRFLEVGPPSRLGHAVADVVKGSGGADRSIATLDGATPGSAGLVMALASLHVHGAVLDWARFEGGARRTRASLPTYPFQRQSYPRTVAGPPPSASASATEAPAAAGGATAFEPWLYETRWLKAPDPVAAARAAGHWLVLADRRGFGEALAAALRARGESCTIVPSDAHGADDVARWFESMGAQPLRGVVHLFGLDADSGDLRRETLSRAARPACESALLVGQALARATTRATPRLWPRLWLVTRGAVAVRTDLAEPLQATLWGLGRSFALESPECWGGLVDLDPAQDARTSADALARHLLDAAPEDRVALRSGERHVQRLARCPAGSMAPLVLRSDGSYLVTGGLGGIGLELAERLVARGARHLVLLGRRSPSAQASARLAALEKPGCSIQVRQADVASESDLGRVLEELRRTGPPLRGVFHSAGVVEDVALARQTWAHFETVFASKVYGTANLDRLTRDDQLDHFVLFSSAVSSIGSVGQANYAAASAYLDALAEQRRSSGRPGLSIQWGAWAEVGLAREETILRGLQDRGFDAMASAPALDALEWAMAQQRPLVAVVPVAWPRFLEQLAPGSPRSLFADLSIAPAPAPDPTESAAVRAELEKASPAERRRLLRKQVAEQVAFVLRLPAGQRLDEELGFFQMGMNSLTTVELRRRIGKRLGTTVSATMVFDHPTVRGLAARMEKELFGASTEEPAAIPPPETPRSAASAAELAAASSDEVNRLLDQELESLGDRWPDPKNVPDVKKRG